jgi:hypothetical protein
MLAPFDTAEQLLGNPEGSQRFTQAGSTLAQLERIRALRRALDELPDYKVKTDEINLSGYRNPAAVGGIRLPRETLPRWRELARSHEVGAAWIPTRAEIQDRVAELKAAA